MPRPAFIPLGLPTVNEQRERRVEMKWLFDLDAPRKPRGSREGVLPSELSQEAKDLLGILPEDE